MSDDNSGNKQSWVIPIVVATIGAISSIVVALIYQWGNGNQPTPKLPSPTPPSPIPSSISLKYTKLEELLEVGDWQGADHETDRLILETANGGGWLRIVDIDRIPCEDLRSINQLWLNYSGAKFGLSVQKEIYQSLGGTREYDEHIEKAFVDRLGWKAGFIYNLDNAPRGHLPSFGFMGPMFVFGEYAYRAEACGL